MWTIRDIPPQSGRSVVVTGGSGGIGFATSQALARAAAEVIVAGRNAERGADAVRAIRANVPNAHVAFEFLDLANLASVEAFADRLKATKTKLDVLVNNAGIMNTPKRRLTADGFESQFGTNFLGHFALTAALLPLLQRGDAARVVTVSSIAARTGGIDFGDLQSERKYAPMTAYCQSKLAGLMFAMEFAHRSAADGWGIVSIAAHPGLARTNLFNGAAPLDPLRIARTMMGYVLFQSAAEGALPVLFAATSPAAKARGYYGPADFNETRGMPALARIPALACDRTGGALLWDAAERLTHVTYARASRAVR